MTQVDQRADEAATEPERVRRSRPRRSTRDRVLTALGALLILAGVAVLGYLAWQFWGTNWMSERKQEQVVSSLEQGWESGDDSVRTDFGRAGALVRIPALGREFAVPVLEGSTEEVLAAGLGHLDDTADLGARGNYVLAGHRVTHGEPFADLPRLEPGDKVFVDTREATYVYELDTGGDDLEVPFTATWVLDDRPVNPDGGPEPPEPAGERLITLLTCSEIFHTDNRYVVFGHLVDRVPRGE